jgi:DNA-binding LytR/AlgR family response regulator
MKAEASLETKTIDLNSISFIRANRCYAKIYYKNKKQAMASKPLANYERILEYSIFIRCHRAFLINIESVKKFKKRTAY